MATKEQIHDGCEDSHETDDDSLKGFYTFLVTVDGGTRAAFSSYVRATAFRDSLMVEENSVYHKFAVQVWPLDDPGRGYFDRCGDWVCDPQEKVASRCEVDDEPTQTGL